MEAVPNFVWLRNTGTGLKSLAKYSFWIFPFECFTLQAWTHRILRDKLFRVMFPLLTFPFYIPWTSSGFGYSYWFIMLSTFNTRRLQAIRATINIPGKPRPRRGRMSVEIIDWKQIDDAEGIETINFYFQLSILIASCILLVAP